MTITRESGVQLSSAADRGEPVELGRLRASKRLPGGLRILPVTRLYDQGSLMKYSALLEKRQAQRAIWVHPVTAARYKLAEDRQTTISVGAKTMEVAVIISEDIPQGVALLPRSV